jgi:aminoglycoside phosphotransferase (APT) family kinase protein
VSAGNVDAPAFAAPGTTVAFDRDRLARYLAAHGLSYDPAEPIRQFAGGLANRNYLVTVDGRPAVLRRPPDGDLPPGAHDMAREHRILSRLCEALPFVPRGLHYCGERDTIGVPFQLIAYCPGMIVRGDDLSPLQHRPDAPRMLSEMMVTTLARIHNVDPDSVGLGDLGRPDGFLQRAVAGWTRRGLAAVEDAAIAGRVEEISGWLGRQHFIPRKPTLLHCDFKLDNMILDPATLQPVAVVDWDMGTRGDPLFDLATLLSYWAQPGDPQCLLDLAQMPTAAPGFWTRAEAARRYAEITGLPIDDLPAIQVLCTFKLAVVFLQLHRQWKTGAVTDARYIAFRRVGEDMLGLAADLTRNPV